MSDNIDSRVLQKFEIQQKIGKGAYGIVWKAVNKKNNQTVAIKKIYDAFQNTTDAQRTFREIMFLQELSGHDNIITLLNVIQAENNQDIYLVFEYMDADLQTVLRAGILEDIHKQYVMYQLFKALKYMHSGFVLHRDVKPSNLLLNSECVTKLADFGLARSIWQLRGEQSAQQVMTDYIATRWYRAPEILLGSQHYTLGVDMWSCGCILGELLLGKPLFPGTSTMNQLDLLIDVTGKPTKSDVQSMHSPNADIMLDNLGGGAPKNLRHLIPSASDEALDLLNKLLQFNPNNRITAEDALKHPYVKLFHNPGTEPVCRAPIRIPVDDNVKITTKEYRETLYQHIVNRKKQIKKKIEEQQQQREKLMQKQQQQMLQQQQQQLRGRGSSQSRSQTNSQTRSSSNSQNNGVNNCAVDSYGGQQQQPYAPTTPAREGRLSGMYGSCSRGQSGTSHLSHDGHAQSSQQYFYRNN
eukprot:TRINITY_DN15844_c0_g2_i1.p1 TRINITY_DN15844_c0_g2~~TRINITY_DN15844_c0_g2_i1.p1  ORF type:complete len:468 (-),score=100.85 TRINITY_DN15844_c0_g2_i1:104-1507(-)